MQKVILQENTGRRRRSSLTSDTELNYNLGILAKHEGRSLIEEARHMTKEKLRKMGLSYKHFETEEVSA